MTRFALALLTSVALATAGRAAELPAGTWAANIDGRKGDFVIKEVKDGKVTATLLGTNVTGTRKDNVLKLNETAAILQARLVPEPIEKGRIKYTLVGTRTEVTFFPVEPHGGITETGWYAQLAADAPTLTGEIKAEVRGVLVHEKNSAYVLVTRKVGVTTEETRVWVDASEWKMLKATLAPLDGKEVVATGTLAQMGKHGGMTVPEGAVYFHGKFDIKLATPPKK